MRMTGSIGKQEGWRERVRPGCIGATMNRKMQRKLDNHRALWTKATDNWDRNRKDTVKSGAAKSRPGSYK